MLVFIYPSNHTTASSVLVLRGLCVKGPGLEALVAYDYRLQVSEIRFVRLSGLENVGLSENHVRGGSRLFSTKSRA